MILDTIKPCKSNIHKQPTIIEAGLDLIMCQQAIPKWLFAKNFWIAQDDNAVTGTSEGNIKPSWIIKKSDTLDDKEVSKELNKTTRYYHIDKGKIKK